MENSGQAQKVSFRELPKKPFFIGGICLLIFVVCIILLVRDGMTFQVYGKFFYTTRYEKTAEEAFLKGIEDSTLNDYKEEFIQSVATVDIDSHNALYLALAKEASGEESLVVAQMAVKDGKYADMGAYCNYAFKEEKSILDFDREWLINAKGKYAYYLVYAFVFEESALATLDDKYTVRFCSSDCLGKKVWIAYYMEY